MIECYIALGANLGNPLEQLNSALKALGNLPSSELLACSPWYLSTAIGPGEQPDYINGVARLDTALEPLVLLDQLQAIETDHGRVRGERWGPRTLDLDLLLYGGLELSSARLTLPHPRMQERNFVLYPLSDLEPELTLPCGTPLGSLLECCPREGLQPLGELSDPGH